ncbi:MAG: hypothetical protein AABZ23_06470 [Deltaproteobacteria bacterium]
MTSLMSLLLPSLVPVASDAIRGIVSKFTGVNPQNAEEAAKLIQAETEKLKALAELDRPAGNISQWVSDLRASFRYIMAGVVIVVACITLFVPNLNPDFVEMAWQGAGSVYAFIFGDRMYSYIRRK